MFTEIRSPVVTTPRIWSLYSDHISLAVPEMGCGVGYVTLDSLISSNDVDYD